MTKSNSFSEKDISQITTYQSGAAQATAHRIINRVVSDYLVQYDLTAMQWFTIGHIYDAGTAGMTMGDIGRIIGTSLPYTTNMVTLLESKGIIDKKVHVSDSRTKVVTLNPRYNALVNEIESGLRDELRKTLYATDNISRQELQDYITVLYKIISTEFQD